MHIMDKHRKTMLRLLQGAADANIPFADLGGLLKKLGFEERTRGSYHLFRKAGIPEMINLQRDGNHAKPYQVRQVRAIILKYNMGDIRDA